VISVNSIEKLREMFPSVSTTLPKMLKEKLLLSINSEFTTPTSNTSLNLISKNQEDEMDKQKQQQKREKLEKCVQNLVKSIKYFEQILAKDKREILASSSTAILEHLIDVHNEMQSSLGKLDAQLRSEMNKKLAELISWSDQFLFENDGHSTHRIDTEKPVALINELIKTINQLIDSLNGLGIMNSTNMKTAISNTNVASLYTTNGSVSDVSRLSTTNTHSTSNNVTNMSTQSLTCSSSPSLSSRNSTSTMSPSSKQTLNSLSSLSNGQHSTTERVLLKSNDVCIVQTSTFSTSSCYGVNNKKRESTSDDLSFNSELTSNLSNASSNFSPFLDLDKLALELSQLSSLPAAQFDRQDAIINKFESFAKHFNSNLSPMKTTSSMSNNSNKTMSKTITVFNKSSVEHELDSKYMLIESINNDLTKVESDLNKLIENKSVNKRDFIESKLDSINGYMSVLNLDKLYDDDDDDDEDDDRDEEENSDDGVNKLKQKVNETRKRLTDSRQKEPSEETTKGNCDNEPVINLENLLMSPSPKKPSANEGMAHEPHELKTNLNEHLSYFLLNNGTNLANFLLIDDEDDGDEARVEQEDTQNLNDYLNNLINDEEMNEYNDTIKANNETTDAKSSNSSLKKTDSSTKLNDTTSISSTCSSSINPNSSGYLSLLEVSNLLEYQANQSSASNLSASNACVNTNSANISCSLVRGGPIDALIVLATCNSSKINQNFLYQEAFLTTYRTMIDSGELVDKLIHRYRIFSHPTLSDNLATNSNQNKSAARNTIALLIRVMDDLEHELSEHKLIQTFTSFIVELIVDDELPLARMLRKKLLIKLDKLKAGTLMNSLPVSMSVDLSIKYLTDFPYILF
jgi:hypothetical protein